jgi:hypothetical protein
MEPQDRQVLGPCPSDGDLLLATSGELPPDAWPIVRQHLEHCPRCWEKTRVTVDMLDTCAQLAERDTPTHRRASRERLEELMDAARADREAVSPGRWFAVAAMLFALVTGITLSRTGRVAYADEVVSRAAQREHAISMPADHWRFRFHSSADGQTTSGSHDASVWKDKAALPAQVVQVLQAHGFDPRHPLSVVRLQAWRASQPDRREQVTHRDGWLVVQTATRRSALREIELVIDDTSFQVVKQTGLFAGLGRVICERVTLEQRRKDRGAGAPRPEPGR